MTRMHSKIQTGGFTLVELMIVISIIMVLMSMVVFGYPVIMDMVYDVRTRTALNILDQAIMRYYNDYDVCPPDSEVAGSDVNNEKFLEAMEAYGITEEKLQDGWGSQIVYDRVRDKDGNWEINDGLPNDPRDEEWFSKTDEEKGNVRTRFFLWSRGKNPKPNQKPPKELLLEH